MYKLLFRLMLGCAMFFVATSVAFADLNTPSPDQGQPQGGTPAPAYACSFTCVPEAAPYTARGRIGNVQVLCSGPNDVATCAQACLTRCRQPGREGNGLEITEGTGLRCGQNPAATCEPVNSRSVGAAPAQTADQPVNSGGTTPAATYQLPNPIGTTDVTVLLGRVVRAFLGVLGSLALFWFVWGGILWMTAEQSEQRVKDAQTIMKNATLGLVIIFFSYGLTTLFLSVVQEVAAPASTQQGRTLGGESPITNNTPR